MTIAEHIAAIAALQWHLDCGIDEVLADEPGLLARAPVKQETPTAAANTAPAAIMPPELSAIAAVTAQIPTPSAPQGSIQGTPALRDEAIKLAVAAPTLEALRAAIAGFEGMGLRRTASNIVFADGNPEAPIMLIGDTPHSEEDRAGRPFVGDCGVLMDKILQAIDLDRAAQDPLASIYMTYALNWRPPGGRSPTPQELELTLPFIERHIALVRPKLLVLCGNMTARLLLNTGDSLSKLRGHWHNYSPRLLPQDTPAPIPTLCTYHRSIC